MGIVKEKTWLRGCYDKDGRFLGYLFPDYKLTKNTRFKNGKPNDIGDGDKICKVRYYINSNDLSTLTYGAYVTSFKNDFAGLDLSSPNSCVDISKVVSYVNNSLVSNTTKMSYNYDFSYAFKGAKFGSIYDVESQHAYVKIISDEKLNIRRSDTNNKWNTVDLLGDKGLFADDNYDVPETFKGIFDKVDISDDITNIGPKNESMTINDIEGWNKYSYSYGHIQSLKSDTKNILFSNLFIPNELYGIKVNFGKTRENGRLEEVNRTHSYIGYMVNLQGKGEIQIHRFDDEFFTTSKYLSKIAYTYRPKYWTSRISSNDIATFSALVVDSDKNKDSKGNPIYVDNPFSYISIVNKENPVRIQVHKPLPLHRQLRLTGMTLGGATHTWDLSLVTTKIERLESEPVSDCIRFERTFSGEDEGGITRIYKPVKNYIINTVPEIAMTEEIVCEIDTGRSSSSIEQNFSIMLEQDAELLSQNKYKFNMLGNAPCLAYFNFYPKEDKDIRLLRAAQVTSIEPTVFTTDYSKGDATMLKQGTFNLYDRLIISKDIRNEGETEPVLLNLNTTNFRHLVPITWTIDKDKNRWGDHFMVDATKGLLIPKNTSDAITDNEAKLIVRADATDFKDIDGSPLYSTEIVINLMDVSGDMIEVDPFIQSVRYYDDLVVSAIYKKGNVKPDIEWTWEIPRGIQEIKLKNEDASLKDNDTQTFVIVVNDDWKDIKETERIRVRVDATFKSDVPGDAGKVLSNFGFVKIINPSANKIELSSEMLHGTFSKVTIQGKAQSFTIQRNAEFMFKFSLYDTANPTKKVIYTGDVMVSSNYPHSLKICGDPKCTPHNNYTELCVTVQALQLINSVSLEVRTSDTVYTLSGSVIAEPIEQISIWVNNDSTEIEVSPDTHFTVNMKLIGEDNAILDINDYLGPDLAVYIQNQKVVVRDTDYNKFHVLNPTEDAETYIQYTWKNSVVSNKLKIVYKAAEKQITFSNLTVDVVNGEELDVEILNIGYEQDEPALQKYSVSLGEEDPGAHTYKQTISICYFDGQEDKTVTKEVNDVSSFITIEQVMVSNLIPIELSRTFKIKPKKFGETSGLFNEHTLVLNRINYITLTATFTATFNYEGTEKKLERVLGITIHNNILNRMPRITKLYHDDTLQFDTDDILNGATITMDNSNTSLQFELWTEFDTDDISKSHYNAIEWLAISDESVTENRRLMEIANVAKPGDGYDDSFYNKNKYTLTIHSVTNYANTIKCPELNIVGYYKGNMTTFAIQLVHNILKDANLLNFSIENATYDDANNYYLLDQYQEYNLICEIPSDITYRYITITSSDPSVIIYEGTGGKKCVQANKFLDNTKVTLTCKYNDIEKQITLRTLANMSNIKLNPASKTIYVTEENGFVVTIETDVPGRSYNYKGSPDEYTVTPLSGTKFCIKPEKVCTTKVQFWFQTTEISTWLPLTIVHEYISDFELNKYTVECTKGTSIPVKISIKNKPSVAKFEVKAIINDAEASVAQIPEQRNETGVVHSLNINYTVDTSSMNAGTHFYYFSSLNENDIASVTRILNIKIKEDETPTESE